MSNFKKMCLITGSVVLIAILLGFPILINYFIMNWQVDGVVGSKTAWLGFISSYYGSLFSGFIGGAFTFGAVYLGFYKNDKDKFLDTYDAKAFALKENLDILAREFIGQLILFPDSTQKLKYYYDHIDLLNEMYKNIKFVIGANSARSIEIFVMSYSSLKNNLKSDGNFREGQDVEELCQKQADIIAAFYTNLDMKKVKLEEKYKKYTKGK